VWRVRASCEGDTMIVATISRGVSGVGRGGGVRRIGCAARGVRAYREPGRHCHFDRE
jgi:hypothetical protein